MNQIIDNKVRLILAIVLRVPVTKLTENQALGQTASWDSLAQLDILAAIEQEFDMLIEPDEAVDLISLKAIIAHIEKNG